MSRTASLMRQSSLPSMGGTEGVPPVAIRMYLDCTDHHGALVAGSSWELEQGWSLCKKSLAERAVNAL